LDGRRLFVLELRHQVELYEDSIAVTNEELGSNHPYVVEQANLLSELHQVLQLFELPLVRLIRAVELAIYGQDYLAYIREQLGVEGSCILIEQMFVSAFVGEMDLLKLPVLTSGVKLLKRFIL
jgi:hypothetical protein